MTSDLAPLERVVRHLQGWVRAKRRGLDEEGRAHARGVARALGDADAPELGRALGELLAGGAKIGP